MYIHKNALAKATASMGGVALKQNMYKYCSMPALFVE